MKADSGVTALVMDDLNNEGIAGTTNGSLFYLNFQEKLIIRIVTKAYHLDKEISILKVCEKNPSIVLSNCSDTGSTVKIWTRDTID